MSSKGWEAVIKYSNRVVSEAVATASGGAAQSYDLDYPAVDELGVITDDETKVEVFLDGVLQATTGIYTLDGDGGTASVGLLTFAGDHDGEVITCSYYAYQTIGYIQSASVNNENNVEPIYEFGSRLPVELKEGNISIGLNLERCFINLSLISMVAHEISAARGWLAQELFDIDVYPAGTTGGYPLITVRGKFDTYDLAMAQDGIAMDTVSFIGKAITPDTA